MKKSLTVIIVIAAAVFVYLGIRQAKTPIEMQQAAMVTVEQSVSGECYIVKKESVYTAENTGTFYSYKSEGERVSKNSKVAAVYNGSVNSDMLSEINNINNKISELKKKSESSSLFFSESQNSESTVDLIKNKIIADVQSGDVTNIPDYYSELMQSITGEENGRELRITELEEKLQLLKAGINTVSADVYADMAGVYTENVDGLEDILTPESIMTYTVEQFDEIEKPQQAKTRTSAETGDKICKVIDNHTWYIMMKANKEKLGNVKAGSKVSIAFESVSNTAFDAQIKYISPETDGECVVVLSCDRYIDGILTMRNTDVRLILKSYTGYKIPIYALRIQGADKGVMVYEQNQEKFKKCDVIYTDEDEGFVIITSSDDSSEQIQPMDNIIIGEKYK